ncbi:MAG: hypothetical protein HY275_12425 [Gemmatimonadetes bacterium]|nr:hypothetical protein [Gemmatimonadota bacterium]
MTIVSVLTIVVLVLAVWTAIAVFYTYSDGDRTGYLQKLSKKGWVCKTWEGELAMSNVPGQMPEKFLFTVHADSLAEVMQKLDGKRVVVSYAQHVAIPTSCFGDTPYWATGVRVTE